MMTLVQIRALLQDRRLQMVAEATGLHENTIRQIRNDETANPTYKVMVALSEYFEKERMLNHE